MHVPVVDIPQQLAEISAAYGVTVRLVARHSGEPTPGMPDAWQPLLIAPNRALRVASALELWPAAMREQLPEFWDLWQEYLYDVVPVSRAGQPALLYITCEADDDPPITRFWFGLAPFTPEATPLGWDLTPELMREFLTKVHGGFGMKDGESFGILPPNQWRYWAAAYGFPDGVPGWNPVHAESSSLIFIGTSPVQMWLCVSKDLDAGQATQLFEGMTNPKPYWNSVDQFLIGGFMQDPWR